MLILLRSWVTPTLISSDDILCVKCFVLLQNQTASNSNLSLVSPARGHLNICYACGLSIASRRTHRVSQDSSSKECYTKMDTSTSRVAFGTSLSSLLGGCIKTSPEATRCWQ
ncbi:uncharacterized protein LOC124640828 [Helicoverpa zea]|uniref:uncharacterized protein LOC124640828 n=1 Tax=Helicoverpa zea TaxID=7113 RepID=UPI001F5677BA|nr:uncharacterized protein LOC124640828 [Helicoverpa zea]